MKNFEERADHEIELIENDDSLTPEEKRNYIRDIQREVRDAMRESERD